MRGALLTVMLVCGAVIHAAPVFAAREQPGIASSDLAFTGFVVDQAGMLTAPETARLTLLLDRFQQRTAHQMAIVTVQSLSGQPIERFTRRLANRWGVGRAGINDGIVLLVAPNERRVRIEIGTGLEASLPDAFCAEVIRRWLQPAFRRGAYGRGVEQAARAISARVSGDARTR